jgi:hydroxyquinol 1,2-dioxygenase
MHDPTERQALTDAVVAATAGAPSRRVGELSEALVRHLHALVEEVAPTTAEWAAAIDFLTRTGQACTDTRQEFILLSDVLGVSMLVDALDHDHVAHATESTVLGPFYVEGAPSAELGADLGADAAGAPLEVEGRVTGPDGDPLAGAIVDTWQADERGLYDVQYADEPVLRARLRCDADGRYGFRTVVPASYPIPTDGPVGDLLAAQARHPYRPAHIHFRVTAPGHHELVTHVFLAGDPYLDSDVVFGVKPSLVRELERPAGGPARLRFDVVLDRARGS